MPLLGKSLRQILGVYNLTRLSTHLLCNCRHLQPMSQHSAFTSSCSELDQPRPEDFKKKLWCQPDDPLPASSEGQIDLICLDKEQEPIKRKLLVKCMLRFVDRTDVDRRLKSLKALNLSRLTYCQLNSVLEILASRPSCLRDWKEFSRSILVIPSWQLSARQRLVYFLFPGLQATKDISTLNLDQWMQSSVSELLDSGAFKSYEDVYEKLTTGVPFDYSQVMQSLTPEYSLLDHYEAVLSSFIAEKLSLQKEFILQHFNISSFYLRPLTLFDTLLDELNQHKLTFKQVWGISSIFNGNLHTVEGILHDPLLKKLTVKPNGLMVPFDVIRRAPSITHCYWPLLKMYAELLHQNGVERIPLKASVISVLKRNFLNNACDMLQVMSKEDIKKIDEGKLIEMFSKPHLLPSLINEKDTKELEAIRKSGEDNDVVHIPSKPIPYSRPDWFDPSWVNKILACLDDSAPQISVEKGTGVIKGMRTLKKTRVYRVTKAQAELIAFLKKELRPTRDQILEIHAALRKVKRNDAAFILKALYNHGFTAQQVLNGFQIFSYDKEVVTAHLSKMHLIYENYEQGRLKHPMGVNFVIHAMELSKNYKASQQDSKTGTSAN